MNSKFIYLPIIYIVVGIVLAGCGQRSANNNPPIPWDSVPLAQQQKGYSMPPSLVTVDLEEDLPVQHLKIEVKETKYIPLETTPTLLLDKDRQIRYLSDNYTGILNKRRGEIFIFNFQGKCVGYLNHLGPGPIEYSWVADLVIDEKAKEIFILSIRNKILVYSFDGKFQRKLNNSLDTRTSSINTIINFNDTALLASSGQFGRMNENSVFVKTPYLLLSKKSGEVIAPLNIRLEQNVTLKGDYISWSLNMFKNGKDIYLSNYSSDTLYHIEQDGKLEPFLVRNPTVFDKKKPQILFEIKGKFGSYMMLTKTVNKVIPNGQEESKIDRESEDFILNLETGEVSKLGVIKFSGSKDGFAIDIIRPSNDFVTNTFAVLVDADEIIDGVKSGEHKSAEIKMIASKLNTTDNPVLAIYKY